ncbi:MAG: 4Fe-4S binding protein [Candidatus Bathyarchaeia archaeon]|nr:4Fe-4S binding protein [Candidatus Bathyarchaeota archaeon]
MDLPVKLIKNEDSSSLLLERIMYTKRYTLFLDRNRCVGCELCEIACPKEAIKVIKPSEFKEMEEPPKKITATVSEDKCNFCGICSEICIFGAFKQSVDGKDFIPVLESESFPRIIHEVKIDESKCPPGCRICEEACPLHLINVKFDSERKVIKVDVDSEHCPGCRICEAKCPYNAIHTRKIITGVIKINVDLCPEGCRYCVDACPIPDVLSIADDGKVRVNESFCVYCGACKKACPVNGAIELKRISFYHAPVKSGAWNKALEKLTSTLDMSKELRSKSFLKAYDSVKRLHMGGKTKR